MNIAIDNGILVAENFLQNENCEFAIDYFNKCNEFGLTCHRRCDKHVKDDLSISLIDSDLIIANFKAQWTVFGGLSSRIFDVFTNHYLQKYSVLKEENNFQIFDIKIQKTSVGGGYHIWHDDKHDNSGGHRACAFIIYLNDVSEGGETELLYQNRRIAPRAGTMLLFPTCYMYAHRGNPPISNEKYILTGWIEYV